MTAFSAKDSTTGLDIDPSQTEIYFVNRTTVDGLDYYRNTMGIASPAVIPEVKKLNIMPILDQLLLE